MAKFTDKVRSPDTPSPDYCPACGPDFPNGFSIRDILTTLISRYLITTHNDQVKIVYLGSSEISVMVWILLGFLSSSSFRRHPQTPHGNDMVI